MSMPKKLVHTKCIKILPQCYDLRPRQYNAVRSSQESVAENHKIFGKVPCLRRFQTRRQAPKMNCTLPVPYGIGSLVVSRLLTFYDDFLQKQQPYPIWRLMATRVQFQMLEFHLNFYAAFFKKPIKMSCSIPIRNNTGW